MLKHLLTALNNIQQLKNELEEQKNNLELGHQSESRSLRTEIAKVATKNNVLQKEVDMLNKTMLVSFSFLLILLFFFLIF